MSIITNYKDSSGNDFSQLFMPLGSYFPISYLINYKISNGNDLNSIFASANQQPFVINSSTSSISSTYNDNYYLITITNTNLPSASDNTQYGNITFKTNLNNCYVICVGGGGNCQLNFNPLNSGTYNFYVGNGGIGGTAGTGGTCGTAGFQGYPSYITNSS